MVTSLVYWRVHSTVTHICTTAHRHMHSTNAKLQGNYKKLLPCLWKWIIWNRKMFLLKWTWKSICEWWKKNHCKNDNVLGHCDAVQYVHRTVHFMGCVWRALVDHYIYFNIYILQWSFKMTPVCVSRSHSTTFVLYERCPQHTSHTQTHIVIIVFHSSQQTLKRTRTPT